MTHYLHDFMPLFFGGGQSNFLGQNDQTRPDAPLLHCVDKDGVCVSPYRAFEGLWEAGATALAGRPAVVQCMAVGGTRLVTGADLDALADGAARWDPDAGRALAAGTGLTGVAGDLYRNCLDRFILLNRPPVRAFLWCQGEWFATHREAAGISVADAVAREQAAVENLAKAVYADFGCKLLLQHTSLQLTEGSPSAIMQPIYDGQAAAVAASPYIGGSIDPSALDLMQDHGFAGNVHIWDVNGVGALWAELFASLGL